MLHTMSKRRHRPLTPEQKAEIEAYIKAQAEGHLPPIVSDGPSRHARYMDAVPAPGPAPAGTHAPDGQASGQQ
jgi:hypothetical protein